MRCHEINIVIFLKITTFVIIETPLVIVNFEEWLMVPHSPVIIVFKEYYCFK